MGKICQYAATKVCFILKLVRVFFLKHPQIKFHIIRNTGDQIVRGDKLVLLFSFTIFLILFIICFKSYADLKL